VTLRELHRAAIRNVPMNSPKENAWFRWWLFRGGLQATDKPEVADPEKHKE
jgi:hypothetical protein